MRRALVASTICLLTLVALRADQQAPVRDGAARVTTGTAGLSGIVTTDEPAARPIRRATVSIYEPDSGLRFSAVTDDRGVFAFRSLPAGRFSLSASRPGYIYAAYGAKRPGRPGTSIVLASGEKKADLSLRLLRGAVITGVVRDANGQPASNVQVMVMRQSFSYMTGEKTLSRVGAGSSFGEMTDDRGIYRVYGLPPDDYFVVATSGIGGMRSGLADLRQATAAEVQWANRQIPSTGAAAPPFTPPPARGPSVEYAPVFYPGTPLQSSATMISLKAGEERTGVDFVLPLTPTAKITGTVTWADGPVPASLQVNTVAHDTIPGIPFSGFASVRTDANGKFVSGGLTPGQYTIIVRAGGPAGGRGGAAVPAAPVLFGLTTVTVDGRDVDVTLPLQPGVTVSGKLVFDSLTLKPPTDLSRIRISLNPARGAGSAVSVGGGSVTADASGAFSFPGVAPGRYQVSAFGAAGGWALQNAIVGGADAIDVPFDVGTGSVEGLELRFTDQKSEISGTLIDASGRAAPDFHIIVFPADQAMWLAQSRRIQSVRPAGDGKFKFLPLPPGEYQIAAVTDVENGEWFDPSFLAQLKPASVKVVLAEGEKKVQDLKIGG